MQISKFKVTFNGCNYEVSRPTKQAGNCVKSQLEGSFNRNMLWGEHRSLALDDGLGTKFKFQSSSIFQGEIINWNTLICLLFQSFFHGTWYFCWFFHLDVDHDSRSSNRCTNLLEFMFFFNCSVFICRCVVHFFSYTAWFETLIPAPVYHFVCFSFEI